MEAFTSVFAISPQLLATGYVARAVHGDQLTLAVVEVDAGAELPEHKHANEQLGMVVEGSVVFRVADETRELKPGSVWCIAADTPHTVTAGVAGAVVIDVFSPPRREWETLEALPGCRPRWPPRNVSAPHRSG